MKWAVLFIFFGFIAVPGISYGQVNSWGSGTVDIQPWGFSATTPLDESFCAQVEPGGWYYMCLNDTPLTQSGLYWYSMWDSSTNQLINLNFRQAETTFYPKPMWGEVGLFGSTSVAAVVSSGVSQTGANVWPLFIVLGVPVAFGIAIYMQNFIMRSFSGETVKKKKDTRIV